MTGNRWVPLREVMATRIESDRRAERADLVAGEAPVALVYNGVSHAVMLATPADLEDFAVGFSLSEGIVDHAGQCELVELRSGDDGIAIQMAIPGECFRRLDQRRRALPGTGGCGLCGSESLAEVMRVPGPVPALAITPAAISAALQVLHARQPLNDRCHGLHAAGFVGAAGKVAVVREDVGRHNALDKLVGALARDGIDPHAGFVVATSRASYEMARKTATAGIGLFAAISAPTTLAIDLAGRVGLTLVAFARHDTMSVYAGRLPDHPAAG